MNESHNPQTTNGTDGKVSKALFYTKVLQGLFWLIGITILLFMIFLPPVGVTLFWNILIPVAPALLVLGTGLWRNVCPLGTTSLLPDRFRWSKGIKLSIHQRSVLNLAGVVLLMTIIPLRHVIFNTDGQATAVLIVLTAAVATGLGFLFERKAAWCSGLCPVHPVEKFYGSGVAFSLPNAHCNSCVRCNEPCADSTINVTTTTGTSTTMTKIIEYLMVGAFPGYVWGWFQVPDFRGIAGWENILMVYSLPIVGAMVTCSVYALLKKILGKRQEVTLASLFAAAAVSCYYWFRLPQLIGFSNLDTNGVLIDLSNYLPAWTPALLSITTTVFFLWWMVIRKKPMRSWSKRPRFSTVEVFSNS
jgi:hypothetical protein